MNEIENMKLAPHVDPLEPLVQEQERLLSADLNNEESLHEYARLQKQFVYSRNQLIELLETSEVIFDEGAELLIALGADPEEVAAEKQRINAKYSKENRELWIDRYQQLHNQFVEHMSRTPETGAEVHMTFDDWQKKFIPLTTLLLNGLDENNHPMKRYEEEHRKIFRANSEEAKELVNNLLLTIKNDEVYQKTAFNIMQYMRNLEQFAAFKEKLNMKKIGKEWILGLYGHMAAPEQLNILQENINELRNIVPEYARVHAVIGDRNIEIYGGGKALLEHSEFNEQMAKGHRIIIIHWRTDADMVELMEHMDDGDILVGKIETSGQEIRIEGQMGNKIKILQADDSITVEDLKNAPMRHIAFDFEIHKMGLNDEDNVFRSID